MMRPLGQTRPLLAYGVPAAAGLAVGGALAAQGEDPGSAALGGAAAALGARGGLGAGRVLAGKYNPALVASAQKQLTGLGNRIGDYARDLPEKSLRRQAANAAADVVSGVDTRIFGDPLKGVSAAIPFPTRGAQGKIAKGISAVAAPAASVAAGLGGVALGAIPGSIGVPGFQQGMAIDPEAPGSSNTASAKYGVTPYASTQYV